MIAAMIYGVRPSPMMLPACIPEYTSAKERLRSVTGTHRASILFMAGIATPSPIPMHARAMSNTGRLTPAAMGVMTVATDHQMTPSPRTSFPPKRSATTPPITYVSRYPQKKLDCTRPTVRTSHPYMSFMGRIATLIFTRSMLHSMNATKHKMMMVQRFGRASARVMTYHQGFD